MQLNLSGDKKRRDLGGFLLLMCFVTLRRTWWQVAPLLEELVPEQPMLTLGFMQEAKHSGVWDRWVRVTKQYHKERAGMLKAAEGPVFSIAGLLPAHLIVARLLEPVHVRHSYCFCWACHARRVLNATHSVQTLFSHSL